MNYDPFGADELGEPWEIYQQLRDEAPAYFIEKYQCWAISRFEDVYEASADNEHYTIEMGSTVGALVTAAQPSSVRLFMSMDPPLHTAFRARIAPHFLPRRVRKLEQEVRGIVKEVLAPHIAAGGLDAVGDLAKPVASRVTCKLLGLDIEAADDLVEWVADYEPVFHHKLDGADGEVGLEDAAGGQLFGFLLEQVAARRASGVREDDVLDTLIHVDFEGENLSDLDAALTLSGLLIGGVETVPKHTGSLIYWLNAFPDQRAKVAADPERSATAVEETFRFDTPTHILGRRVKKSVDLHGETLGEGDGVLFLYASANRDEREYERPGEFDIDRSAYRTLSFGAGTHLCMGLHTARLESRIMLEEVLAVGPDYTVDESTLVRGRFAGIRGYRKVEISF